MCVCVCVCVSVCVCQREGEMHSRFLRELEHSAISLLCLLCTFLVALRPACCALYKLLACTACSRYLHVRVGACTGDPNKASLYK